MKFQLSGLIGICIFLCAATSSEVTDVLHVVEESAEKVCGNVQASGEDTNVSGRLLFDSQMKNLFNIFTIPKMKAEAEITRNTFNGLNGNDILNEMQDISACKRKYTEDFLTGLGIINKSCNGQGSTIGKIETSGAVIGTYFEGGVPDCLAIGTINSHDNKKYNIFFGHPK